MQISSKTENYQRGHDSQAENLRTADMDGSRSRAMQQDLVTKTKDKTKARLKTKQNRIMVHSGKRFKEK